ncbi:MAG: hypothetical protein SNJ59_14335 [Aggregatilineales bacterium]
MKRILLACLVGLAALFVARVSASPTEQAEPAIVSFTTTAEQVSAEALISRAARIPVAWETRNRPLVANLVFDQIMPDGGAVNVELPRALPWVVSTGEGLAAPISPGAGAAEVVLRMRMVHLFTGSVLAERALTVPIAAGGDAGAGVGNRPAITRFISRTDFITPQQVADGSARVIVEWETANRPLTSNLIFEQVLDDGSLVNVELPREDPLVASSGVGVVAPEAPGRGRNFVTLRLSLFDLLNGRIYDRRELIVPVTAIAPTPTPIPPTPTLPPDQRPRILYYDLHATSIDERQLADRAARITVSWAVAQRPANSNLVFEQILDNGIVVNVELPRPNPIVPSMGEGLIAPFPPGDAATSARFILSLVNVETGQVYDRVEVTLPISPSPTPVASPRAFSFTTTATSVEERALLDRTARVPVSWAVTQRPPNSNLVFEQVLANGSALNVELPRPDPIVPSSGDGVVAPILPAVDVMQIHLRVRLVDLATGSTLDQRDLRLPVVRATGTAVPRQFTVEFPPGASADYFQLAAGEARVPISWQVSPRPANSNLVFEQLYPDGRIFNVELPRPNPIVSSSGTGVVAPTLPPGETSSLLFRVRLVDLTTQATLEQRQLRLPISGYDAAAQTAAEVVRLSVDQTSYVGGDVVTVEWEVIGADSVSLSLIAPQAGLEGPAATGLPASGTTQLALPPAFAGAAGFVELRAAVVPEGPPVVQRQLALGVIECQYQFFFGGEGCASEAAERVAGLFQDFENGTILRRADSGSTFILFDSGAVVSLEGGAAGPIGDPPSEMLLPPSFTFETVWYPYREQLGWAVAPEGSYSLTIQRAFPAPGTGMQDVYLTLADESIIRLTGPVNNPTNWSRID